jgi:hypothetical protein
MSGVVITAGINPNLDLQPGELISATVQLLPEILLSTTGARYSSLQLQNRLNAMSTSAVINPSAITIKAKTTFTTWLGQAGPFAVGTISIKEN